MEIETSRIRPLKDALVAHGAGSYPPRPLLEALLALLGDDEPVAAMGARDAAGKWGCVVITESDILYGEALKDGDTDYDLGSREQAATKLSAQMWSRDRLAKLSVLEVRDRERDYGTAWSFDARFRVTMDDGAEFQVPPDGKFSYYSADEALLAVISALKS